MMRILTFILALSVFYMSTLTCADTLCEVTQHEESVQGEAHSHDHSDDEDDDCTPFCTCDCCGASITVPQAFVFNVDEIPLNPISSYTNFYSLNYSYDHTQGVWHPPTFC